MRKNNKKQFALSILFLLPFLANCFAAANNTPDEPGLYTITLQSGGTHIVGESTFTLSVVNNEGGANTGLNFAVEAEMDMGSMVHTTPIESITDNSDGTYTVKLYYLMPSTDSWVIKAYVDGTLYATLPVAVTGDMMDKATLYGISDQFKQMMLTTNRPYFIFKKTYTAGTGSGAMSVFLATRKTLMSHPPVVTGLGLVDETDTTWNIGAVSLEVYDTVNNNGTWQAMTSDGNGTYSITGANLTGMVQHFRLKITKGGVVEQKTLKVNNVVSTFDNNTDPTAKNLDGSWVSNGYGHLMVP